MRNQNWVISIPLVALADMPSFGMMAKKMKVLEHVLKFKKHKLSTTETRTTDVLIANFRHFFLNIPGLVAFDVVEKDFCTLFVFLFLDVNTFSLLKNLL